MEVTNEKKKFRRLVRDLREEYMEENDCTEVPPKKLACSCSGVFDNFDAQTHEAWLMQCPKSINPQQLVGKRIKLPGRRYIGDLQVRSTPYNKPLNEAVGYVNTSGKYALRKMPLAGYVVVSKRLNGLGAPAGVEGSEFPVAPPPKKFRLPIRHPLFGRNYKKHVELPAAVSQELKQMDIRCTETTARLRRTANYYTIKSRMLATTQSLVEKERDVRQSVVSGITPRFMDTTLPGMFPAAAPPPRVQQDPKKSNGIVHTNGHGEVKIKQEVLTPKKDKKRNSNGEVLVNGTAPPQGLLVTIKEEPESPPEKRRRKQKATNGEDNVILIPDEVVVVKQEESDAVAEAKPRKRKSKGAESVIPDEVVVVKQEENDVVAEAKPRKRKSKGAKSVIPDEVVVVKQEESDAVAEAKPRKRKSKKGERVIPDEVIVVKQEPEAMPPKRKAKGGESVIPDEVVVVKQAKQKAEDKPRKRKAKGGESLIPEEATPRSFKKMKDTA